MRHGTGAGSGFDTRIERLDLLVQGKDRGRIGDNVGVGQVDIATERRRLLPRADTRPSLGTDLPNRGNRFLVEPWQRKRSFQTVIVPTQIT